jgi:predicted dehydrogenase
MPELLNVALIGAGFMGRAHASAWLQVARFFDVERRPVLHTACGRDGAALVDFAARWGFAQATARWQEACADPAIELVDVATPNDLHAAPAIAALAAGKYVCCEKPLARTLEEARAMRDAARKARARTFVWFNYRRCPAVAFAWKLVREGALGELYHVRARYLQSWGGSEAPLTWRFKKRLAGSGAHGDLNAHMVDMARFLVGEPVVDVHGALSRTFVRERPLEKGARGGGRRKGRSDVDDCTAFLASFAGGATASFEATRLALGHLNDNAIELNGSKGSLRFAFSDMNALELFEGRLARRTAGWRRVVCTAAGEHPYAGAWWPDEHLLGYEHGFTNMAADVLRVLAGGRPEVPLPDFADAYETQRVLAAALVAAGERRAVKLSEVR